MARIRSLKPEAFSSETLAEVSVCAERTMFGMSTIADDRGRLADKPAQINGELWSMRGNHSKDDLEGELCELEKSGLVCRYIGCDGRRYLHLVTWDRHQKIDHPSKTRLPRCPHHLVSVTGKAEECGLHEGNCRIRESVASPREPSRGIQGGSGSLASPGGEPGEGTVASENGGEQATSADLREHESSRDSREPSRDVEMDLGPRTVDLGSRTIPPTADAGKPRRRKEPPSEAHVGTVVAAYVDGATEAGLKAPPSNLRARVGRQARQLLTEGWEVAALVASARVMGAGEYNDLAVQVRKDDAAANGKPAKGAKQVNYTDEEYTRGWGPAR